jgi:hypothetical protein
MNSPHFEHRASPARHRLKQSKRKGLTAVNDEVVTVTEQPLERQIGNTTYILTTKHSATARETLLQKIWRLIRNNDDEV